MPISSVRKSKVNRKVVPIVLANIPLVISRANSAHLRLSKQTRQWIDIEDLVQDGILACICDHRYNPNRGAKYTTYMYMVLDCVFKNDIIDPHRAEKRYDGKTSSIEDLLPGWDRQFSTEEPALLCGAAIPARPEAAAVAYIKKVLPILFREASPALKQKMLEVFSLTKKETKLHTQGKRFDGIKEEFLALSRRFSLGLEEHLIALHNDEIKASLYRADRAMRKASRR